eukprot:GEMP01070507.1.p1 GENE.GEMP01070507.1~~GEMP01070507.1.p1  ORF type:complete len:116 (-),score=24.62 GEMP01070507.1:300-647(-)
MTCRSPVMLSSDFILLAAYAACDHLQVAGDASSDSLVREGLAHLGPLLAVEYRAGAQEDSAPLVVPNAYVKGNRRRRATDFQVPLHFKLIIHRPPPGRAEMHEWKVIRRQQPASF